jgi:nucleoid DNA-binding protein
MKRAPLIPPRLSGEFHSAREVRMNKQDIVSKIAKDTGLTKVSAAAAIDSILDGITKSLKKGDAVSFVGFGTFKTSNRKARTARNPQTGAAIKIPKRRVPRFSAGKALKQAVR